MPKRPETYMNDRREQILDAVERCIVRCGWEKATIDEIAREAKLSKGALYIHFPSKRSVMIGMLNRNRSRIDSFATSPNLDALREAAFSELSYGNGPDGWRHATGFLELYAAAARDDEARAMFGESFGDAIAALVETVRKISPGLSAQAAKSWITELVALIRGLAVIQAIGGQVSGPEIDAILDRHFERIAS